MSDAPAPTLPDPFGADEFAAAISATLEQRADLERFHDLVLEWNGRMNLVGPSAHTDFWRRHVLDSAQLLSLEPRARIWSDLGAGAGFPGVVLAILLKETSGARVHLVESITKRCGFLSEVTRVLSLPVEIHNARAETLGPLGAEVVTARACAPLTKLLAYAQPQLRGGATGLFLKGRGVEAELTDARKTWRFNAELLPSVSDPSGRVVRVERLARV